MFDNPAYASLERHLAKAYEQASEGKGKERHANDNPFEDQPICEISRMLESFDFNLGQAIKKCIESKRLYLQVGKEAALRELYGAINYIAGACELIEEEDV